MPLLNGPSAVGENIKILKREGRSYDQALAIAMKHAGKDKTAKRVTKKVAAKSNPTRKMVVK